MSMSNMLNSFFKQLKIAYISLFVFNVIYLIFCLIYKNPETVPVTYLLITHICINIVFSFLIGTIIYGSYGKTFAFIQNNKKQFGISSFIIYFILTVLISLFTAGFTYIIGKKNIFNISTCIIIFFLYFGTIYIGSLYGLLLRSKKTLKTIVTCLVAFIVLSFIYFFFDKIHDFVNYLLANSAITSKFLVCFFIIGLPSIISCIVSNILYLKLPLTKVYSAE